MEIRVAPHWRLVTTFHRRTAMQGKAACHSPPDGFDKKTSRMRDRCALPSSTANCFLGLRSDSEPLVRAMVAYCEPSATQGGTRPVSSWQWWMSSHKR
mgnify:CR=1 FL=1